MRSPVQALLWEQWRRLRWPMAFALVLMVYAFLLYNTPSKRSAVIDDPDRALSFFMMSLCIGVSVAFLLCSHSEANDLRLTLPSRLYTLPVKTHVLVNCELFFRLASVGLLAFVMLGTHYLLFGDEYLQDASFVWKVPLVLMGFFLFVQGFCWWAGGLWILAAIVSGTLLLTQMWRIIVGPLFGENWEATNLFAVGILALFAGAGYLIALGGVRLDRCGARMDIRKRLGQFLRVGTGRQKRFSSPACAQLWFEWRRKGKYVPIVAIASATLWFLVYRYLLFHEFSAATAASREADWETMLIMIVGGGLFVCPLVAAFVVGMLIPAQDHRDHTSGFSCFLMTRPMRTRELAAARLKMGALSLGSTYAFVSLILIVLLGLPAFLHGVKDIWAELVPAGAPELTFLPIVMVLGGVALAWTLLWLSLPLLGALLLYSVIVSVVSLLVSVLDPIWGASVLWWIPAIHLVGIAALVRTASRHTLLTVRDLPVVAALGLISAYVMLVLLWASDWPSHELGPAGVAVRVAVSLLPAVAFIWEPVKLHWLRHR
jgi:hypothetical protein